MDKYLNSFREMISLRGLTDHTIASKLLHLYLRLSGLPFRQRPPQATGRCILAGRLRDLYQMAPEHRKSF